MKRILLPGFFLCFVVLPIGTFLCPLCLDLALRPCPCEQFAFLNHCLSSMDLSGSPTLPWCSEVGQLSHLFSAWLFSKAFWAPKQMCEACCYYLQYLCPTPQEPPESVPQPRWAGWVLEGNGFRKSEPRARFQYIVSESVFPSR